MLACPSEEILLAFVEDRLRPDERAKTEAHVSSCGACGSLLAAVTACWHAEGRLPAVEPEADPVLLAEGARVGRYTVLRHAGSGAMGEVYRAHDPRLGRDVALKLLPARFAADPSRLARFQKEARAAGATSHPNLLAVFDLGEHEGCPYLVTEWLEGTTLRDRLLRGPLGADAALRLGIPLARGLAAAHAKGIVHRDLKPANLFLCGDGSCRILDFGLARLAEEPPEGERTQTGAVVGTAGYMAPEQIRGQPVDARADLFALGAVLYEAVGGHRPFGGNTAVERMSAALRDDPPRLPGALGEVLARCLAKRPAERFQSAQDLAFSLEALAERSLAPAVAPRARLGRRSAAAALLALGLAAAVALVIARSIGSGRSEPARPDYRPITFRRGHVLNARFSADGHTVFYGAAWDGGPAALYSARAERPFAQPLGVVADVLAASPQGELAVLLAPRFYDPDHGSGTLARMTVAGGAPRAVLDDVMEADWSPDGSALAVVRRVAGRYRLELPAGTVRYASEGWISHARISRDGRRIAFLLHPNPKDDRGAVMVLEGDAPPRELSGGWSSVRGLAWSPAGDEVWFSGSRVDTDYALYAVNLRGSLRRVDRVAGRLLLEDVARDGTVLADHQAVRVGLAFGHLGGGERDLTWSDSSFLTDLSPDGKWLLFAEGGQDEGPSYGAYLRATDGSPPIRLGDGIPFALSPDGKRVFATRGPEQGAYSLLPTGAGAPEPVSLSPIDVVFSARWFPDGKRLLVRGVQPGRTARLWIVEPDGRRPPRPFTAEGEGFDAAISARGDRIAAVDNAGTLRLWSGDGEPVGGVPGGVPGGFAGQSVVGWEQSGAAVFLRSVSLPVQITRVDVRTGASTQQLAVPALAGQPGMVSVLTLSLSGDGQHYAYSFNEALSRLYLIHGLQ